MTVTWCVAEPSQRCPSHVLEPGRHQRFWAMDFRSPNTRPNDTKSYESAFNSIIHDSKPEVRGICSRNCVICHEDVFLPERQKIEGTWRKCFSFRAT